MASEINVYKMPENISTEKEYVEGLVEKTRFKEGDPTQDEEKEGLTSYENFKDNLSDYLVKVEMTDEPAIWAGIKQIIEENGEIRFELQDTDLENYVTYGEVGEIPQKGQEAPIMLMDAGGDVSTVDSSADSIQQIDGVHVKFGKKDGGYVKTSYVSFQEVVAELKKLKENETYTLTADLDASGYPASVEGIIKNFSGTLDGAGHKISGLKAALFDTIRGGTVKNLVLENGNVATGNEQRAGILARETLAGSSNNKHTTITNVHVSGSSSNNKGYVGGLIGKCDDTDVDQCSANVTIVGGTGSVGGLIGVVNATTSIRNSYAVGSVHGSSGSRSWGGLVGWIQKNVTVENCYANVKMSSVSSGASSGFVGYLQEGTNNHFKHNVSFSSSAPSTQKTGYKFDAATPYEKNGWNSVYQDNYTLRESSLIEDAERNANLASQNMITSVSIEELSNPEFYKKLGWNGGTDGSSEEVWDFSPLADGNSPLLKSSLDDGNATPMVTATEIADLEGLKNIKNNLYGVYRLGENIDASSATGVSVLIDGSFKGTLYGDGYEISGLNVPLFKELSHARISNLKITGSKIIYPLTENVGALAQTAINGTLIEKVVIRSSSVQINNGSINAAGLAGTVSGGTKINECASVNSDVSTEKGKAAAFVAVLTDSEIEDCYAGGTVTAASEESLLGALAAEVTGTSVIRRCYADADVSVPDGGKAGSFIGKAGEVTARAAGTFSVTEKEPEVYPWITCNMVYNDSGKRYPFVGTYAAGDTFEQYSGNYVYEYPLPLESDESDFTGVYDEVWEGFSDTLKDKISDIVVPEVIDEKNLNPLTDTGFYEDTLGFDWGEEKEIEQEGEVDEEGNPVKVKVRVGAVWNLEPVKGGNRPKLTVEGDDFIYNADVANPDGSEDAFADVSSGEAETISIRTPLRYLAAAPGNRLAGKATESDPIDEILKKIKGYDERNLLAYKNLIKMMPFYEYEYIIQQGNALIDGHKLKVNEIESVYPLDAAGVRVVALAEGTETDPDKISKIRIQFKQEEGKEKEIPLLYDLEHVSTKSHIAAYRIKQNPQLHYMFNKYLVDTGEGSLFQMLKNKVVTTTEKEVVDPKDKDKPKETIEVPTPVMDFDAEIETRLPQVDNDSVIDSYRRNYNEEMMEDMDQILLSFLANNSQYPANMAIEKESAESSLPEKGDSGATTGGTEEDAKKTEPTLVAHIINSQLLDNGYLKDFLYAYDYVDRWYNFEIGGINLRDVVLFDNSILPGATSPQGLVSDIVRAGNANSRQGSQTQILYRSLIKSYTGIAEVSEFVEHFMTDYALYENVNDWIIDNFKGGITVESGVNNTEIQDPSEKGLPGRDPNAGTRIWRLVKSNTYFPDGQMILPVLSYRTSNYLFLTSFTTSLAYGNLQIYGYKNPSDPEERQKIYNYMYGMIATFKNIYDNFEHVSDTVAPSVSKGKFLIIDTSYNQNRDQDVFKEFYKPLGTIFGAKNGAMAVLRGGWQNDYVVYNSDKFLDSAGLVTLNHEMGHITDSWIWLEGKGKRSGRYGEDYCNGFANQTGSDYNMNYLRTYARDSQYLTNLTPERIMSQDQFKDYYRKVFTAMYTLDYLQGLAYLDLTPEQQEKVTLQHLYGPHKTKVSETNGPRSTWTNLTAQQLEDMDLQTLEDLWDNQLTLRPGSRFDIASQGAVGISDYGAYNLDRVAYAGWYVPYVDGGTPNAQIFRRNAFELAGYAGYTDGLVKYLSSDSSGKGDLEVFKDIINEARKTDESIPVFTTFKQWRMDQYKKVAEAIEADTDPYFDKDALIEYMKQGLLNPGNAITTTYDVLGKLKENRESIYRYLQRVTDDFTTDLYGEKEKKDIVRVNSAKDLLDAFADGKDPRYIVLEQDITLGEKEAELTPVNKGDTLQYKVIINKTFIGKLDFNGHKIMMPATSDNVNVYLFSRISTSYVSDVNICDSDDGTKQINGQLMASNYCTILVNEEKTTENDVLEIKTLEELKKIGQNAYHKYRLAANIDVSSVNSGSVVTGRFASVLDGAGHTISGLKVPLFENVDNGTVQNILIKNAVVGSATTDNIAVVAKRSNHARFEQLDIRDASITGRSNVGVVSAYDRTSSIFSRIQIRNSSLTAAASGKKAGLVGGELIYSKLENINVINSTAKLAGTESGGFIGLAKGVDIDKVFSGVDVTVENTDTQATDAGFIGSITAKSSIKDAIAAGSVTDTIAAVPSVDTDVVEDVPDTDDVQTGTKADHFYKFAAAVSEGTVIENCYEIEGSGNGVSNAKDSDAAGPKAEGGTDVGTDSAAPEAAEGGNPEVEGEPENTRLAIDGVSATQAEQLKNSTFYTETLKFNCPIVEETETPEGEETPEAAQTTQVSEAQPAGTEATLAIWYLDSVDTNHYPELIGMVSAKKYISSEEEFIRLLNDTSQNHYIFTLTEDLDFSKAEIAETLKGKTAVIEKPFAHALDGAGHQITGLSIPLFAKIEGSEVLIYNEATESAGQEQQGKAQTEETDAAKQAESYRCGTVFNLKFHDIQISDTAEDNEDMAGYDVAPAENSKGLAVLAAETKDAVIETIEMRDIIVSGHGHIALLTGSDNGSAITSVQIRNADVIGDGTYCGVFAGQTKNTKIEDAAVLYSVLLAKGDKSGGFIGSVEGGSIKNVFADVNVTIAAGTSQDSKIAGFVGEITNGGAETGTKFEGIFTTGDVVSQNGEVGPEPYKFTASTDALTGSNLDKVYEWSGSKGESNVTEGVQIQVADQQDKADSLDNDGEAEAHEIVSDRRKAGFYKTSLSFGEDKWDLTYVDVKAYPELKGMSDINAVPVFNEEEFVYLLNEKPEWGYVLRADLDFTGREFTGSVIDQPFKGTLEGMDHTVSGLTTSLFRTIEGGKVFNLKLKDVSVRRQNSEYAAAFAERTSKAEIRRLNLSNISLSGSSYVAPVVGYDDKGSTFSQIQVQGANVSNTYYYGSTFIGRADGSQISDVNVIESSLQFQRTFNGGFIGALEGTATAENVFCNTKVTVSENYYGPRTESAGFIGAIGPQSKVKNAVMAGTLENLILQEEGKTRYEFKLFTSSTDLPDEAVENCYVYDGSKEVTEPAEDADPNTVPSDMPEADAPVTPDGPVDPQPGEEDEAAPEKEVKVTEATEEDLKSQEFYTDKVKLSEEIWNLAEVDHKDYPELRGMETNEVPIRNIEDIKIINQDISDAEKEVRHYILTADLDFTNAQDTGTAETLISGTFTGVFDGNGHTVTGLNKPMFDKVNAGTVKNLVIKNSSVTETGEDNAAVLARSTDGAVIENIDVSTAAVSGKGKTAGLVGYDNGSQFARIQLRSVTVQSNGTNGGVLIGLASGSRLRDIAVISSTVSAQAGETASISGEEQKRYLGGLVGNAANITAEDIFCDGDITVGTAPQKEEPEKVNLMSAGSRAAEGEDVIGGLFGKLTGESSLTGVVSVGEAINYNEEEKQYHKLFGERDEKLTAKDVYEAADAKGMSDADPGEAEAPADAAVSETPQAVQEKTIRAAKAEELLSKTFYQGIGFAETLWNLNYLSMKHYPELRGMEEKKVTVTSLEQFLKDVQENPDMHFILATDLDFTQETESGKPAGEEEGIENEPDAGTQQPVTGEGSPADDTAAEDDAVFDVVFSGTLEGGGHCIRGLTKTLFKEINGGMIRSLAINGDKAAVSDETAVDAAADQETAATFAGAVLAHKTVQATVSRLDISNVNVNGTSNTAVVSGHDEFSTFTQVQIYKADVKAGEGKENGVLLGYASSSRVRNAAVISSRISISHEANGGLIGSAQNGTEVRNVYSGVDVTVEKNYTASENSGSAGFIGVLSKDVQIDKVISTGKLSNPHEGATFYDFTASKDSLTADEEGIEGNVRDVYVAHTYDNGSEEHVKKNETEQTEGKKSPVEKKESSDLKNKEFYTDTLGFGASLWNFDYLNLDEDPHPELKGMEKSEIVVKINNANDLKTKFTQKPEVSIGKVRYLLTADLDLSKETVNGTSVAETFKNMIFDGGGHSITGLTVPLFGTLQEGATVTNLQIKDSRIEVKDGAGGGVLAREITGDADDKKVVVSRLMVDGATVTAMNGKGSLLADKASNAELSDISVVNCTVVARGSDNAGFIRKVDGGMTVERLYLQTHMRVDAPPAEDETEEEQEEENGKPEEPLEAVMTESAGFIQDIQGEGNSFTHILVMGNVPENTPNVTAADKFTNSGAIFEDIYEWTFADGLSSVCEGRVQAVETEPWSQDFYVDKLKLSVEIWDLDNLSDGYAAIKGMKTEVPPARLEISTPEGLLRMNKITRATYYLTKDIDMADLSEAAQQEISGKDAIVEAAFTGKLDGQGYKIRHLTKPLFKELKGTVTGVTFESVRVELPQGAANALAMRAENATIRLVFFNGMTLAGTQGTAVVGQDERSHYERVGVENVEVRVHQRNDGAPEEGTGSAILVGSAKDTDLANVMVAHGSISADEGCTYVSSLIGRLENVKVKTAYSDADLILPYDHHFTNVSAFLGGITGTGTKVENAVSVGGVHPVDPKEDSLRYKFVYDNDKLGEGNMLENCYMNQDENGCTTESSGLTAKPENELKTQTFYTTTLKMNVGTVWDLSQVGAKWPLLKEMPKEDVKPSGEVVERKEYPGTIDGELAAWIQGLDYNSDEEIVNIHTAEGLINAIEFFGGGGCTFILKEDISLYGMRAAGTSFLGDLEYDVFDGNNHTISDIEGAPLFDTIQTGQVQNLRIKDVKIEKASASERANALARELSNARLLNIDFENVLLVGGSYTGLLAGKCANSFIQSIWAENIDINPYGPAHRISEYEKITYVGGLIGQLEQNSATQYIANCYIDGQIVLNGKQQGGVFGGVNVTEYRNTITGIISNMRVKATLGEKYGSERGGFIGALSYNPGRRWLSECIALGDAGADAAVGSTIDINKFAGNPNRATLGNGVDYCYEVVEATGISTQAAMGEETWNIIAYTEENIKACYEGSYYFYEEDMSLQNSVWDFDTIPTLGYPTLKFVEERWPNPQPTP